MHRCFNYKYFNEYQWTRNGKKCKCVEKKFQKVGLNNVAGKKQRWDHFYHKNKCGKTENNSIFDSEILK